MPAARPGIIGATGLIKNQEFVGRKKVLPKLPTNDTICGCIPSSTGPKANSPPGIRRATAATRAVVGKSRGSKEVAQLISYKRQTIWRQNKQLVVHSKYVSIGFMITVSVKLLLLLFIKLHVFSLCDGLYMTIFFVK